MTKNHLLIINLLAILIVLGIGSAYPLSLDIKTLIPIAAITLLGPLFTSRITKLCLLVTFTICLSLIRLSFLPHHPIPDDIDFYNNQSEPITIITTICAEPDIRHIQSKYTVCAKQLVTKAQTKAVKGKILLTCPRWPEYHFGDRIKITGNLQSPFVSNEFDYEQYLARYGIYSEMRRPRIEKIGFEPQNPILTHIFAFKDFFTQTINQVFPEPQAAFLDGLLRGAKKGLPPETFDEFQRTGLTHIIAVSGFNITIIIAAIMAIFGRISRRLGAFTALFAILFFIIFTGMSPAVIRAGIMGSIAAFAIISGRQNNAATALLLAATIMSFYQPLIIWNDIGFQLSFLATAGIIFVSPFFEKWANFLPDFLGLKEAFLLTVSAQITVIPLIAWHFGHISLIAPLANVAVAPFIILSMATGFIAILTGMISPGLGIVIGIPAYISLSSILQIAHYLSQFTWAYTQINTSPFFIIIYYTVLTIILIWGWSNHPPLDRKKSSHKQ